MAIEVKQMIIKSTVVNERTEGNRQESVDIDVEQLKERLLEECRELIAESLNKAQER